MKIMNRYFILPLLLLGCLVSYAQDNKVVQNYIDTYKSLAIAEMQRTGVPASIKLAQGIHETMAGTSVLVNKSNNHFGIKCKSNWSGESVSHDDDARGECFRKYESPMDSYRDHSNFLKGSPRYASLFSLDPTDYAAWAYGLKKAGYATNPRYPALIIKLIEDYNLQEYTLIAMGKTPASDFAMASPTVEAKQEAMIPAVTKAVETIVRPRYDYPQGEFRIHDTRVVFVRKGTSYLSVAQEFNVSLARIFEFNELSPSEVAANDQLVYLQRKRKTGHDDFYIVQPGETLKDIAQSQGIRLESLREFNWLKEGMEPAAGEKLSLKEKSATMPRLALKDNYSISSGYNKWNAN